MVPDGFVQPPLPRLGQASTVELVRALEDRGGWRRDTAARLLFERRDPSANGALEHMVRNSKLPEARMHCALRPGGV